MSDYAIAWNRWFPMIEGGARGLSLRMLELAGIGPGHQVLDLATGIGEPALTAAGLVGPEGRVLGIDISSEMIRFARERAEAAGATNAEFQIMDADALTLPDEAFDAVLCRWGLMFVDDLASTLGQLRSSLRAGGRLSVSVWGPPEEAPSISLAPRTVHQHLGLPPPGEGAMTAFAHCDAAAFVASLEAAGFGQVDLEQIPVTYDFASPEDFVAYRRDISTPLLEAMAGHGEDEQMSAWRAVARAAEDYRSDAGTIRMVNWAYCLSATRA